MSCLNEVSCGCACGNTLDECCLSRRLARFWKRASEWLIQSKLTSCTFGWMSLISAELINHANEPYLRLTAVWTPLVAVWARAQPTSCACLVYFCFWHFYPYLFFFHPLTLASDPFISALLEHVSQVHCFSSCLFMLYAVYLCSLLLGVSLVLLFQLWCMFLNGNYYAACSLRCMWNSVHYEPINISNWLLHCHMTSLNSVNYYLHKYVQYIHKLFLHFLL